MWPGLRASVLSPAPTPSSVCLFPRHHNICDALWARSSAAEESGRGLDRGTPCPSWETDVFPAMVNGGHTN